MDTLSCIQNRRSVRKYKSEPVEWDKVVKILEAGRMAPSSGNIQNWRFIVVKEFGVRKKIAQACFDQEWIKDAPILIVVTADSEQAERLYGARGEVFYTIQNVAAATTNLLLAATALDLGSCWVGAFDERLLRAAVVLPENIMPHAVITIGYADEKPKLPPKKRIEWLVNLDKWGIRKKAPTRGYISEVTPKIVQGMKDTLKRKLEPKTEK